MTLPETIDTMNAWGVQDIGDDQTCVGRHNLNMGTSRDIKSLGVPVNRHQIPASVAWYGVFVLDHVGLVLLEDNGC